MNWINPPCWGWVGLFIKKNEDTFLKPLLCFVLRQTCSEISGWRATFSTTNSGTKKGRNRYDMFFWKCVRVCVCVCVCVCIYRAACLQTVWLSGCLHHHSLPHIDPPAALLLSALLCCIDVFSNDFHTHCVQIFVLLSTRMRTFWTKLAHKLLRS